WQNVGAGEYHISAVAIDNQGEMTGSEAVHLFVESANQAPMVLITSPLDDAEYTSPASIMINAQATDLDGTISRVDFYRGTQKIGEDTTAPYSYDWQNVGAGEYHISAVAIDNQGEMTGSEAIHVVVNQPTAPTPEPPQPSSNSGAGVDMAMCQSFQIPANAKYVALSGNDSNDGSMAHPYGTVRAAVADAVAGDTIVLRQGTYNEPQEIRIRVPNITITSYPGEWAVIDRSSDQEDAGVYFYVGSDGGSLKCVEVKGGFYAVSTETQWDWGEADRSGASNILIENTKLHDSFRDVVKIKPQSDDVIIRHNEIYNSSQGQMNGDCNAEGIDNVNGDRNIVSYNYIHNTCSNGIYLKGGATDGIVEHNFIENTGGAGIILGFDTSPEYFDLATNPNYYENISGIARYNLIKNTGWAGIALYASKDAQVYNNTIVNSASIYHSPIYFGVTFQDWEPEAGRPANINPNIHDNIVFQGTITRAPLVGIRYADELGGLSGLSGNPTMKNNCYYQSGTSANFEDGRSDWSGGFTAWQNHISGDSGSLIADPMFDAHYKPTNSQCIGKGY
ncbi:right-handed parallel beta-helix repeat-containing protein, partial [Patescibacteria group bacterium]|nr:right-handed parallel beta-helix repeat-containing protein [Patescibacteria group bacterium]